MILRRLGNKSKIATEVIKHFPPHRCYLEPFFGAGGLFFNKPKSKYNILNDIDSDVFNLFNVLRSNKTELYREMYKTPISEELWHYWRKNKEIEPIFRAIRFLFLSNFGYMGKPQTMRLCNGNSKGLLLGLIEKTYNIIWDCEFTNADFRVFFNKIPVRDNRDIADTFVYCDPPYLGTDNNYETDWTLTDTQDLFKTLKEQPYKFAMSEFDNEVCLDLARDYGFIVNEIGERQNMKNRRNEILITNYQSCLKLF